jgi:ribosomal protein S18 acetylase RimI-like enzyme
MTYQISIENGHDNYSELEPNYRAHFSEMQARLMASGVQIGGYNPRLDLYFEAFDGKWLINYVVRFKGKAVGHSNVYVTADMHTSEKIASEDTIYILPEHRNGIGKKLVQFILVDLQSRGVKRVQISPVTDLRVAKIWRRMGFTDVASLMSYTFKD